MEWYYYLLIGLGTFGISLLFQSIREFYSGIIEFVGDFLGDILGEFGEVLVYIITFQWVMEIPDFFSSMFENITDVSMFGLAFGIIGFLTIFLLREQMVIPFVRVMSPASKVFWTISTYAGVFVGGYFMGKHFENS